ncbi:ATP-dependent Clp protease proteolytic subunit [Bradyrhizobium brasilense]|uniref:ATP-dependent Clp protease proteolytic subunit n=1 Tax=Bradyrhizobium brasilense TaxID=1419277 RepID=UPI0024B141D5|nr:ATP-dependent Clp protease proteolytic subunit [Bradyrhizobium australafricanum]WFU36159.1 ATP-dependent Clp protease proteolytic subunit [Bradyrhizobium australafricanum]
MFSRLLFFVALLLIPGVLRAEDTPVQKAGFAKKLTIYLAHGPANACGAGCDRWIAIEGEIDREAAQRIRTFLFANKDRQLPIYLHSPGGNVEQSYGIARFLRAHKAIARVGRTIVPACSTGTQIDAACLKIKAAKGEVEAELTTRNAMCVSACAYLFLGATSREVAPDSVLAVHNSKLMFVVHGHPPAQAVADFRRREMVSADRDRNVFLAAMGISHELSDLIKSVKFEDLHVLTRPELYRFGIDTRPLPETLWAVEKETRPYVRKIVQQKRADGSAFRMMEWRLFCESKDRGRLMFVREFEEGAAGKSTVVMMAGATRTVAFGRSARFGKYEVWSEAVTSDIVKAMLAAPHLQIGESPLAADAKLYAKSDTKSDTKPGLATFDIGTTGLEQGWTQLLASCPAATAGPKPASPLPAAASPSVSAVPAASPSP